MINLKTYDYFLPEKNLALFPVVPRDTSKIFVYDTKSDQIIFDKFFNLDKYLPDNSFMVLNNTKVLPARIEMKKETGGKVIVLFLVNEPVGENRIKVLTDRKINVGEKIYFKNNEYVLVESQNEHIFILQYSFSKEKLFDILKKYGVMPIPPYLKRTSLKRDELIEKYQTIFAKYDGSAAAPTASLHFTDRVFKKLEEKEIEKEFVTLHVGLGTFAPLTEENIKSKTLHEEYFEITKETQDDIKRLKEQEKKLVSVGTTVTRTLESYAKLNNKNSDIKSSIYGKTDLFIYPPYDFKMVDILITNFHLPKSSLMMLVEAFLRYKQAKRSLVELYEIAISNNYRFYSFGDAMVII